MLATEKVCPSLNVCIISNYIYRYAFSLYELSVSVVDKISYHKNHTEVLTYEDLKNSHMFYAFPNSLILRKTAEKTNNNKNICVDNGKICTFLQNWH